MIDTRIKLQEVDLKLLKNGHLFNVRQLKMARRGSLRRLKILIQDSESHQARIFSILNMVNQVNVRYRERNSTILNHACDVILKELEEIENTHS